MPYKSDAIHIDHTKYDRRIKLTDDDKAKIKEVWISGVSIREISRQFRVDKRLIQFILFPERHEHNLELRELRGGSTIYYQKDKHREYIKRHRRYKHELQKEGVK